MQPQVGQVVTVFRSRLRAEGAEAYGEDAGRISELARTMPGYVEHEVFTSADGERVTLVTFADHVEYSIQVGVTSYASAWPHA